MPHCIHPLPPVPFSGFLNFSRCGHVCVCRALSASVRVSAARRSRGLCPPVFRRVSHVYPVWSLAAALCGLRAETRRHTAPRRPWKGAETRGAAAMDVYQYQDSMLTPPMSAIEVMDGMKSKTLKVPPHLTPLPPLCLNSAWH